MKKLCLVLLSTALLSSCYQDDGLDNTILVPDENDPNLPAYTEWGYNSFGVRYERRYFTSTTSTTPCKVRYKNDSLAFTLQGALDYYDEASLTFTFPAPPITTLTELSFLNGKNIDLASEALVVLTTQNSDTLQVREGTLYFQRFQEVYVDGEFRHIVLSGRFEFGILHTNPDGSTIPETFKNGRFDLSVSPIDFLILQAGS
jgi:hypothetical protein